jgi:hypothetical protein
LSPYWRQRELARDCIHGQADGEKSFAAGTPRDKDAFANQTRNQIAMQQIKIFKAFESNLAVMEKEVNTWLKESGARVVQMFGNLAPQSGERNEANSLAAYPYVASDVLLVILYEPK